jgi:hypothetical protein
MPKEEKKNRPFNLIKKRVEIKETVKVEKDWYILFNILFVFLIVLVSGISFLFKVYMQANLNKKREALASKMNTSLNTVSKEIIKGQINVLNDKFSIYQDFLSQNFNINEFYNDVQAIYPGITVEKFSAQPNSKSVEVDIRIESNGYVDMPQFMDAIDSNTKFKSVVIKGMSFSLKDSTKISKGISLVDERDAAKEYVTQITLSIVRLTPQDLEEV